jgi:ParB/RepB/Spo0J family partition protein
MKTKAMLSLFPSKLTTHPKNMRRFYPVEQVREMADSILANKGVLEPLIVTRDKDGKWLVVDGNMRLAGARLLGSKCPPLDCKEVAQNELEQALAMVTANRVRYDPDPVSEGMHYLSLKNQGLTVREISKRTGVYEARISNTLVLAELEEPVQKLIVDGKLSSSHLAAKALLRLTPAVRIKLAKRLSENPNTKISTIITAVDGLLGTTKAVRRMDRPAVELSGAEERKGGPTKGIREAMKKVCEKCSQYDSIGRKALEPAWSVVMHRADEVCAGCPLKDIEKICGSCPAVALLRKLTTGRVGAVG